MRLWTGAGALLSLTCACSSFDAAPPAGSDAGSDTGATSGDFFSDDFDALDCANWNPEGVTLVRDTTQKRSGAAACRVCSSASVSEPYLTRVVPARGAGSYQAAAWTHSPSWGGLLSMTLIKDGTDQGSNNAAWAKSAAFERVSTALTTPVAIDSVRVVLFLDMRAVAGECFWLDDVGIAHVR